MSLLGCYWHVWLRRFPHGGTAPADTQVSRGFEPRSLDSESGVLTVTPRDHLNLEPFLVQDLESHRRLCWSRQGGGTLGAHAVPRPCSGPNRNRSHGLTNKAQRPAQKHMACLAPSIPTWWHGACRYKGFCADLNRDRWIQSPEC